MIECQWKLLFGEWERVGWSRMVKRNLGRTPNPSLAGAACVVACLLAPCSSCANRRHIRGLPCDCEGFRSARTAPYDLAAELMVFEKF